MIGGSSQCQIRLLDSMIGEDFICLDCYAGNYHMEASNSRYGVYVNGFKVNQTSFDIREGDFLQLSDTSFIFQKDVCTSQNNSIFRLLFGCIK